jgi:hypothetical protein
MDRGNRSPPLVEKRTIVSDYENLDLEPILSPSASADNVFVSFHLSLEDDDNIMTFHKAEPEGNLLFKYTIVIKHVMRREQSFHCMLSCL